ncbi:MAG: response regulator [Chloroflexi bacterium]|nr:response regulator [Chloroflexota bacterium]
MGRSWLAWGEGTGEGHKELEELRLAVLQPVLWGMPVAAWGLILTASFLGHYPFETSLVVLFFGLLASTVLARLLLPRGLTLAATATVAALFATVSGASLTSSGSGLATLFSLVVIVAVATLGLLPGLIVAAAASGVAYVEMGSVAFLPTSDDAGSVVMLAWASALLAWAASRPVYTALSWAWASYDDARATTRELRERQRELSRALKSLNEAYDRLEHLNDELARARKMAEEARRLKAEFAANISHELRTPLNLIIGFSEVMAAAPQTYGGERLPEAYRIDVDAIYRSAYHLSGLIDDVLELSQIEVGRVGLVREELSLAEVIREAVGTVAPLFDNRGLYVRAEVPEDLPRVSADRTRVRQVVINLLTNAGRFTSSGGARVTARLEANDVVVSVADTGIGIAPENLPRVFEEFYQVDGSLRREVGGSGLGLTISKQFVELHGGSMWVESRVGAGTAFHFALPLASNVISTVPPGDWVLWDRRAAARAETRGEVVVVTSDSAVARIFERHLDGYRVTSAPSLEVAMRLQATEVDSSRALVVVASSPAQAWQELRNLEQQAGDEPIVLCSLPGSQDLALELGVAAYLVKPIVREDLLSRLERLGPGIRHVLVVDDDPDMVRLLGRMVRSASHGYRVWPANGGQEALALLRARRPDAVLLDLLMPEVNGHAVLQAMRQDDRLRDVPVVVVTSRSGQEVAMSAGLLTITRPGGLSVRELMGCLGRSLSCLLAGPRQAGQELPPAPPGAAAG